MTGKTVFREIVSFDDQGPGFRFWEKFYTSNEKVPQDTFPSDV